MSWHDWIGNFSYALLALSYLVTNMLWLRTLAIAALGFEALYLYFGSDTPLWVGIAWSGVFVAINGWQVLALLRDRFRARLDEQDKVLHRWLCPALDDVDFHRLIRVGLPVVFEKGTRLCEQGHPALTLFAITDGDALVSIDGRPVRRLAAGSLAGEASFFSHDVASADVIADRTLRARAFPKAALRELTARHEGIRNALNETIGKTLATKLMERRAGQA